MGVLFENTRLCRLSILRQYLPQPKHLTYLNKGLVQLWLDYHAVHERQEGC